MNFESFISQTAAYEERLRNPASFYSARLGEYEALARRVAREILIPQRTADVSPQDWRARVDALVSTISATLLPGGDGITLTVHSATQKETDAKGDRGSVRQLTFDEVRQWVEAGIKGKPGGKVIREADQDILTRLGTEKGTRVIASTVMKAYYSLTPKASYGRLRSAISQYLFSTDSSLEAEPLLQSIAIAWTETFLHKLPQDLKEWSSFP